MSSHEARHGEAMRISSNGERAPAIRVLRSSHEALSSIRIDAVGAGEVPAGEQAVTRCLWLPGKMTTEMVSVSSYPLTREPSCLPGWRRRGRRRLLRCIMEIGFLCHLARA